MITRQADEKNELTREELLEQRQELLASIKYASFIQKSILPETRYLDKILNEYFVFHLPRDIVSGDFYYCTTIDELIIVAAGDCTGHGVPGALMSIMGASFLNDILSGNGPWKVSKILNLLRERIMKTLHQTGDDEENKDAIDMALLIFDNETGTLQNAGANNPLYHIRNGSLSEIKADKMPVGVNAIEEESFTNHVIQLISDDMVYIFSDGYADQFGGPANKKYKYGPFKKLLASISTLDPNEQMQKLEDEFYRWKGNQNQVDDVLILGIKFL